MELGKIQDGQMKHSSLPEHIERLLGWGLLLAASLVPGFSDGHYLVAEHSGAAFLYTALLIVFLTVVTPRLGSVYELQGVITILLLSASTFLILNHVLAHHGEGLFAWAYGGVQALFRAILSAMAGGVVAELTTSPLYLMSAAIVLAALAARRLEWLSLIYGVILLSGVYPISIPHVLAYLLWFAGLALVMETPLYLPAPLLQRLQLTSSMRHFLVTVRSKPLTEPQTIWHLSGSLDSQAPSPQCVKELSLLSAACLIEYDPAVRLVTAAPLLKDSAVIPGSATCLNFASLASQGILLVVAGVYVVIPLDLIPEGLVGPVGLIDDLVVAAVAAMPLAANWHRWRAARQNLPATRCELAKTNEKIVHDG